LVHGETGYLVEPGNIQELAEAMNQLACKDTLFEKLGSSTRERVLKMHTWDRHVDNILNKLLLNA
jgi:glycosyltransferase involved in cell wall biosynthesis